MNPFTPTQYLVFVRNEAGTTFYLDGGTKAGEAFGYTKNRTRAQPFTRAECVAYVRDLITKLKPGDGFMAGFEGL